MAARADNETSRRGPSVPDHVLVATDVDEVVVGWNAAAAEHFGWHDDEAAGLPFGELVQPVGGREEIVAGQLIQQQRCLVRRADGARVTAHVVELPVRDEAGTRVGAVRVVLTVGEHLAAQQEAVRAEARLAAARRQAGVGSWEWNLRTGEAWRDATTRKLLGIDREEHEPSIESWLARVHPDDRHVAQAWLASPKTRRFPEQPLRVILPDASVRVILAKAEISEWIDDTPSRLTGVVVDVTEERRAAQRVIETVEAIADGYLAIDRTGRFTYVNAVAEQLLARPRGELLGESVFNAFADAVSTERAQRALDVITRGDPVELDAYVERLDTWFEIRAYPHVDGVSVYFRDANARQTMAEEHERLRQAEQASRAEAAALHAELRAATTTDPLTGLANRRSLLAWLDRRLGVEPERVALLCCDVDRFKYVNDALGHSLGDDLLVAVGRRLSRVRQADALVARIGGDEFAVALSGVDLAGARLVADELVQAMRTPLDVAGRGIVATTSVGLALATVGATAELLLRDADAALYRAKDLGRDRVAVADDGIHADVLRRLEVESALRTAMVAGGLTVAYQPSYALDDGRIAGIEALARLHDAELGNVEPGEFIPIAEDTGLIVPLGELVLDVVGHDVDTLPSAFPEPATVWVNASGRQLTDVTFLDMVERHLTPDGTRLGIEVTETILLDDPEVAERALRRLTDVGVVIAVDDFGMGYSSLARLATYPIHLLKIDRSFVAGLGRGASPAIVAAIIELGHALGARVVAEGVETAAQLDTLRRLGCDDVSGYYLARPVGLADLAAAIGRGRTRIG